MSSYLVVSLVSTILVYQKVYGQICEPSKAISIIPSGCEISKTWDAFGCLQTYLDCTSKKKNYSMKEGRCPIMDNIYGQFCETNCRSDSDCFHDLKCCTYKCGKKCVEPWLDCPPLTRPVFKSGCRLELIRDSRDCPMYHMHC